MRLGGRLELSAGFLRDFFDAPDDLFRSGCLFHPFVDLADLHIHRPDDFVHAVGLHDGVFDGLLLAFKRLSLSGDMLGKRVQRAQALFDAAAQLLQRAGTAAWSRLP